MVHDNENSGWLDAEVETDNRALKLKQGSGDAVNNAGIGRESRLELAEVKRRGAEERRRVAQPVLDARMSQEREIYEPIHGRH